MKIAPHALLTLFLLGWCSFVFGQTNIIGGGLYGDAIKSTGSPLATPIMFSGNGSSPSTSAASYSAIIGPYTTPWSTAVDRQSVPISVPGTFSNLQFSGTAGSGSGVWSATLRVNGASTALTCTTVTATTPTTCSDISDTVNVAAGDLIDWQMCPGTIVTNACSPGTAPTSLTTGLQISALFTSSNNGEGSVFVGWSGANPSNVAITYTSLGTVNSTTEVQASSVMSTAGTFDHLYVNSNVAPGTGKQWAYTVWKNGVATGVECIISSSATSCNSPTAGTDTPFTVVATDLVSVEMCPGTTALGTCTVAGSPTTAASGMSLRWQPTATGEVMGFANNISNCPSAGASFTAIQGTCIGTEGLVKNLSPVAMHYTKMQIVLGSAVGAGATRTNTLRVNAGTASGGAACTISAAGTTCNNTGNYSSSVGDLMGIGQTFTGSPGAGTYSKTSMTMTVP